jgi:hypothetical protein
MAVGALCRAFLVADPLLMTYLAPGMEGKFYGVELFVREILVMATLALEFSAIVHGNDRLLGKGVVFGVMVALPAGDSQCQVFLVIEPGRFLSVNDNFLIRCLQCGGSIGGSGSDVKVDGKKCDRGSNGEQDDFFHLFSSLGSGTFGKMVCRPFSWETIAQNRNFGNGHRVMWPGRAARCRPDIRGKRVKNQG